MKVRTKRSREVRETIKKAGIWVFIAVFVISIVGVAVVTVSR